MAKRKRRQRVDKIGCSPDEFSGKEQQVKGGDKIRCSPHVTTVFESSEEDSSPYVTTVFESSEDDSSPYVTTVFESSEDDSSPYVTTVFESSEDASSPYVTTVFESSEDASSPHEFSGKEQQVKGGDKIGCSADDGQPDPLIRSHQIKSNQMAKTRRGSRRVSYTIRGTNKVVRGSRSSIRLKRKGPEENTSEETIDVGSEYSIMPHDDVRYIGPSSSDHVDTNKQQEVRRPDD